MEFKKSVGYDQEGYELYEVQAIREKKIVNGRDYYFIKWMGWPEGTNTWEPIENLKEVFDLVDEYNKNLQEKNNKNGINSNKVINIFIIKFFF